MSIDTNESSEASIDRFFPLQFPRWSIHYITGAACRKVSYLSRIIRHVSYIAVHSCKPLEKLAEPVRCISLLHLRPVRARTTGFALRSVKTCWWMRRPAENDGISRVASITQSLFFICFVCQFPSSRRCYARSDAKNCDFLMYSNYNWRLAGIITRAHSYNWRLWSIEVYVPEPRMPRTTNISYIFLVKLSIVRSLMRVKL